MVNIRREETSFSCQDCDVDVVHGGNLLHQFSKAEVVVSIECIELLWDVKGDDGGVTACLQCDLLLDLRHCCSCCAVV